MSERVAAIDCGTNSLRLLIAELTPSGDLIELDRRVEIVRLGQGVDATGSFAPEALARVFAVIEQYAAAIRASGVTRTRFVATSAARDVSNRDEFFQGIQARLGITPEVISGDEEAQLTFQGAITGLTPGQYLVADIGGGSTELVLGDATGVRSAESLDIGSVRLTERHLHSDPPAPTELAAATADIDRLLDTTRVPLGAASALVGVAGTVTTVAAVALGLTEYDRSKVHHARIANPLLTATTDNLLTATRAERARNQVIHPGRVDVIGAGALILQRLVARLDLSDLIVSEHDILDGAALSLRR